VAGATPAEASGAAASPEPASAAPAAPDNAPSGEGADSEGSLSFRTDMWDRFEFLWQNRIEPSQRLLEQVTSVLRSRAQLERQYSGSLRSIPDEVQLDPQESTMNEAIDAVMVNFRNRAEQSLELAEQIDCDIVLTFEEVIKQHKEVSKRLFMDANRLAAYCRDTRQAYDRLAGKFHHVCSEAELTAQEILNFAAIKSEERVKMGLRTLSLVKQSRTAEHNYSVSIEQANRAQALFDEQMPLIFEAMQDMEMKRAKCLRDGLMKLAVYETSWLRNLQYDIEATVKAAEVANPSKDLQDFIQRHKAEEQQSRPAHLAPKPFYELGRPRQLPMTPARKLRIDDDRFMKEHYNGLLPLISGLFAEAPPAGLVETVREKDLETLRQTLSDTRIRVAVIQALKAAVIGRQVPQTEPAPQIHFEDRKAVRITAASFEVVVSLVLEALSYCDQFDDAWSGREFMVLVQKICSDGEGGKIVTLLQRVYKHSIWNKVTFWEDSLLVGLCEAHSVEAIWRRSRATVRQAGEVVVIPFLQHFVEYMLSFGIRCEQVKQCITATLDKNRQLLGRSQEAYSRLLMQYAETAAAKQKKESENAATAGAGGAPAPAPRTLEESTGSPGGAAAGQAAESPAEIGSGPQPDDDDDFAAVALGVQDSFGEQLIDQEAWEPAESAATVATAEAPPMTASLMTTEAAADTAQGTVTEEDAAAPPVEAATPDSKTAPSGSGSPEGREPADALRKLGVDQPTSSDVFG